MSRIALILCCLLVASCAHRGELKTPAQIAQDQQKAAEKEAKKKAEAEALREAK